MNIRILSTSIVFIAENTAENLQLASIRRQATEAKLKWKVIASTGTQDYDALEVSFQRRLLTDDQAKMLLGMLEQ